VHSTIESGISGEQQELMAPRKKTFPAVRSDHKFNGPPHPEQLGRQGYKVCTESLFVLDAAHLQIREHGTEVSLFIIRHLAISEISLCSIHWRIKTLNSMVCESQLLDILYGVFICVE